MEQSDASYTATVCKCTWESEVRNWNPDASRFEILQLENWNPDVSGIEIRTCPDFEFCNWKIKIRTCPELKFGHVRNWNFPLINENPDMSGFFFFKLKIGNLDTSRFQFSKLRKKYGLTKYFYYNLIIHMIIWSGFLFNGGKFQIQTHWLGYVSYMSAVEIFQSKFEIQTCSDFEFLLTNENLDSIQIWILF